MTLWRGAAQNTASRRRTKLTNQHDKLRGELIHGYQENCSVITEDKFYTIAAANGKVVEVKDYNTENGAQIQLWDNANAEWQQWSFVRAGEGVYRIKNRFTG